MKCPEPYMDLIIQHNKYVVNNGQMMHSDLSAPIVDIQLLNFRFDIDRIQKRNESIDPSPRP